MSSDAVRIELLKCHIRCQCHGEIKSRATKAGKARQRAGQRGCAEGRAKQKRSLNVRSFLYLVWRKYTSEFKKKTSVNASELLPLLESVVSNTNIVVDVSVVPTTGSKRQRLRYLASSGRSRKLKKLPKSLEGSREPSEVNTGRTLVHGDKLHV